MATSSSHSQTTELTCADLDHVTGGDGKGKQTTTSTDRPSLGEITLTKVTDAASPGLY
jgi:type VI protein secretion system component Hcp